MEKNLAKAQAKDSLRALGKLTTIVDGEPRIVSDPPLIVPIEDLTEGRDTEKVARQVNRGCRRTLQDDANICSSAFGTCTGSCFLEPQEERIVVVAADHQH
jgi:hypothetical protein